MDKEIAATLNQEGFVAARGCKFKGENVLGEVDIVSDQIQHKRAKWSSATAAGRWSMIVLQRTYSDAHFRLSGIFMTACLAFPDFVLTYLVIAVRTTQAPFEASNIAARMLFTNSDDFDRRRHPAGRTP
jgi:hypothetical protein